MAGSWLLRLGAVTPRYVHVCVVVRTNSLLSTVQHGPSAALVLGSVILALIVVVF